MMVAFLLRNFACGIRTVIGSSGGIRWLDRGDNIASVESEEIRRVAATISGPSTAVCVITTLFDALATVGVVTRYA